MAHDDIIEYLIRPDDTVVEIHGGWDEFARDNEAADLTVEAVTGRKLSDFVADPETRMIYAALIDRVLETGEPLRFAYRCDGPACRRHMSMEMDRVAPEAVRFRSRMIRREARQEQPLLDPAVTRSADVLVMCSWCKRLESGEGWMEVEDYVARTGLMEKSVLPRLSHGICPACEEEMDRLADPAA